MTNDEFESARLLALRAFDVTLADGSTARIYAHLHDGGQNPSGHLNFITINREGHQKIDRSFNARAWRELKEIGSELAGSMPPLPTADDESSGGGDPDPIIPRRRSRAIH